MLTDVVMTPLMLGWNATSQALWEAHQQTGAPIGNFVIADPDLRIPREDAALALVASWSPTGNPTRNAAKFFSPSLLDLQSPPIKFLAAGDRPPPSPLSPPPRFHDNAPLDSSMIARIGHLLTTLAASGRQVTVAVELEAIGDEFVNERADYSARCYQGAFVWLMEREMCGETIDGDQRERLREKLGKLPTVELSSFMPGIPATVATSLSNAGVSQHALDILSPPARPRVVGLPPSFFGGGTAVPRQVSAPSIEAISKLDIELSGYKPVDPIPGLVGENGELLLASWQKGPEGQLRLVAKVSTIRDLRFIAAGGMGLVFAGKETISTVSGSRDVPPLPVVLKTIQSQLASDHRLRNRFFLEEWVATLLRHRNILTVRGLEWTQDGRPIMLMPYQRGWIANPAVKDLENLLKFGPLDLNMAVEDIFLPILDAVAYAHQMGVIHRDLKPANIFIDQEGGKPVFRVGDFGVAYLVDNPKLNYDVQGMVPGTPGYMSLEAQMGKPSETTDVFALGATFYEALAGMRPIDTTDSRSSRTNPANVWLPKVKSMKEFRPEIPFDLERIVLRAMGYTPQQQSYQFGLPLEEKAFPFKTARELYAALHYYNEARKANEEAKNEVKAAVDSEMEAAKLYTAGMEFAAFEIWRRKMEEVIARYDVALGKLKGHGKSLEDRRWRLLWQLFEESEHFGEEDLVYPRLAHHPDYSQKAREPGRWVVEIANPPEETLTIDLVTYRNEDGVFKEELSERFLGLSALPPSLPKGIYALRLSGKETAVMQIPFLIRRGQVTELKFRLHRQSEVPEGYAVIPPGPVVMDLDPTHYAAASQTVEEIPYAFAVKPTLVTRREYVAFLNDLIGAGRIDEALALLPRTGKDQFLWHQETIDAIRRGEPIGEVIYFAKTGSPTERADPVIMEAPVVWISHEDAVAWSAWASQKDGFEKRLPTRLEWLRLLRGNDSRIRPWGDAEYVKGVANVSEPDSLEEKFLSPVGQYYFDRSPFSHPARVIADLFGNAREYTGDTVTHPSDARIHAISVGSGFIHEGEISPMKRYTFEPNRPLPHGFRVVYRIPQ